MPYAITDVLRYILMEEIRADHCDSYLHLVSWHADTDDCHILDYLPPLCRSDEAIPISL